MTITWRRLTTRIGLLCFLAAWLQTTSAGPFGSAVSGQRGDPVTATLFDSVVDFEAGDIRLTFDPIFLSFTGVSGGTLTSGFFVLAGLPTATGSLQEVLITMAAPGAGVTGDPPDSLLIASFLINNSAPFDTTSVVFEPRLDLGLPPVYDFAPTAAQITVLRSNSVPIGNTGVLVLMGLAAMFRLRLRRR